MHFPSDHRLENVFLKDSQNMLQSDMFATESKLRPAPIRVDTAKERVSTWLLSLLITSDWVCPSLLITSDRVCLSLLIASERVCSSLLIASDRMCSSLLIASDKVCSSLLIASDKVCLSLLIASDRVCSSWVFELLKGSPWLYLEQKYGCLGKQALRGWIVQKRQP